MENLQNTYTIMVIGIIEKKNINKVLNSEIINADNINNLLSVKYLKPNHLIQNYFYSFYFIFKINSFFHF